MAQSTIPMQSCSWGCPVNPTHTPWDGIFKPLITVVVLHLMAQIPVVQGQMQPSEQSSCGKSRSSCGALLPAASSGSPAPAGSRLVSQTLRLQCP